MSKVAQYLVGFASLVLTPFYGLAFIRLVMRTSTETSALGGFLLAFAAGTVLCGLFIRQGSFLAIFEHEFTHTIWALLFLKKPIGFSVFRNQGGQAVYSGGNFVITLAPYFSPTLCFLLIPLYYVLDHTHDGYYFSVMGFLAGFHAATNWKELSPRQEDLQRYGLVFSYLFIAFAAVFCFGLVLAFVVGRGSGMGEFAMTGIQEAWRFTRSLAGP